MSELLTLYPTDRALFNTRRDYSWGEKYGNELKTSVARAITSFDLDAPLDVIMLDPVKRALALELFTSVLSTNGPMISPVTLFALKRKQLGEQLTSNVDFHFTSNHTALPGWITMLDSGGNPIKGTTAIHNMPAFATRPDGKPTIGDISPISMYQRMGKFLLELETPRRYKWIGHFTVHQASELSNQVVGNTVGRSGEPVVVYARDISMPCASGFQVTNLRHTCAENCTFCSVTRGSGFITPEDRNEISATLTAQIDAAAQKGHAFQGTLSGGSEKSPDGGFNTAHEWALDLIEEKVKAARTLNPKNKEVGVQVELEMMLPPDQSTWDHIIDVLNQYAQKPGWKIGLAINMEALDDSWKGIFLQGKKGTLTLENHIAFARLLKEKTGGIIKMSTLIMFGLKPVDMTYSEYMLKELEAFEALIAAGILPELAPVKFEADGDNQAYPPTDPVYFMIQYLATRKMRNDAGMSFSPGCVGSCSACHNLVETNALLRTAKDFLPKIFEPILETLGPDYQNEFSEIFV